MIYICEKCGIVYKAEYQPTECESCGCTHVRRATEREVLEIVGSILLFSNKETKDIADNNDKKRKVK